jgi:predicted HTH domain antitoxin
VKTAIGCVTWQSSSKIAYTGAAEKVRRTSSRRRASIAVLLPDDVLQATRTSAEELKQEFAVRMFQKEKLTLG